MHRNARRAAQAIQVASKRSVSRNAKETEMAVISAVSPLALDLVGGGLTLAEDILILSSAFRRHERDFGLSVGDTVSLTRQASGDYLVHDVQTENEVMQGLSTEALAGTTKTVTVTGTADLGTGAVTATASLVAAHWLEAFDADGNSIGFVPVFASKT